MFYIIHTEYVGPNPEQHLDAGRIAVVTTPGRTNLRSRKVVVDGWLGETDGWSQWAHGAYATMADAAAAVHAIWPETHAEDEDAYDVWDHYTGGRGKSAVATWRPGRYGLVTTDGLDLADGLEPDTTDAEIAESAASIETSGNTEGWSYAIGVDGLAAAMRVIRDGLRDEVAR